MQKVTGSNPVFSTSFAYFIYPSSMFKSLQILLGLCLFIVTSCNSQPSTSEQTNLLICDPAKGVCEAQAANGGDTTSTGISAEKSITIHYFTDPICSACWGIEPQLRKMKLAYGEEVSIIYHMGGLLPDWSYNSGGISKPSDVAHHWDEVSKYYNMPIDGDVWLEDPLDSSYPPSIAFKAAQMQDLEKALVFLRIMREMVFLEKKNIAKWEVISQAATMANLDVKKLRSDFDGPAKTLFEEDLALSKKSSVRGFPTLILSNKEGKTQTIYGFQKFEAIETVLKQLVPQIIAKKYNRSPSGLFFVFPSLTVSEFAELSELTTEAAQEKLEVLVGEKKITKFSTKNGSIYRLAKP